MIGRPAGDGALSREAAWALALVATLTMAISYVDRQTLAVLAPTVRAALGITPAAYGWLAGAFSLAYLFGAPLAGRLLDELGARRGLLVAVLVWSLVAASHALVPGFISLFALRIALGLAEAPSFPGATQVVQRALPPPDRARGIGVLFTGSSIGSMIAPIVATWLCVRWGWRSAFLGTAVVGLVWVPAWLAVSFRRRARAVLDVAPQRRSEAAAWSMIWHPAVLRQILVVLAAAPAIGFLLLWGAEYLVQTLHLTQADVGHYLWLPPLCFDAGSVLFGDLASRRALARSRGPRAHHPDYALLTVAALLELSLAAMPLAQGPWAAMAVAGVAMLGGGGLYAIITSDMLARVPPSGVALAGSMGAAAQSLMHVIFNPLVGYLVMRLGGFRWIVVGLGVWVIPGCAAWLAWRPPPRLDVTRPDGARGAA